MGQFYDFLCAENEPYEREFVLDLADITLDGEMKCKVSSASGTSTRYTRRMTSGESEFGDSRNLIFGLVIALAVSVIFLIGFLLVLVCFPSNEASSARKRAQPKPEVTAPAGPVGQPTNAAQTGTAA
ncbi:unnamed protein product [Laminaria digitata]